MYTRIITISLIVLICFVSVSAAQETDYSKVEIKTTAVTSNIYMLGGKGGNLGVSIGEDGTFLVDDQYAPLTEKILNAIGELTDKPVRLLINTHYHFDHVGGNENMGKTGAVIISHENVRKRMNSEQFVAFFKATVPAYPHIALPIITFTNDIGFHLNSEEIEVFHLNNAHTDGDAVVYFKTSNVLHTGDIYFNTIYPFIDTSAEGSVDGVIAAVYQILSMIDDETRIIPGHGPLSNKKELKYYVNMLETVRGRIRAAVAKGKTLEETQADKPTAEFDEKLGNGFLTPDLFVQILYTDLSR